MEWIKDLQAVLRLLAQPINEKHPYLGMLAIGKNL